MKRLFVTLTLSVLTMLPVVSHAAAVESIGIGISPLVSYSTSELTDSTFPTSLFLIGGASNWRLEYLSYEPNLASSVNSRQYKNSSIMAYYNVEYLLRARRGSVLGRTRLFIAGGAGVFRSRLNSAIANSEYNLGYGVLGGFRYFFDRQVFFGGEAKYLYSSIIYNNSAYEAQDIGGLFLSLMLGIRFGQ